MKAHDALKDAIKSQLAANLKALDELSDQSRDLATKLKRARDVALQSLAAAESLVEFDPSCSHITLGLWFWSRGEFPQIEQGLDRLKLHDQRVTRAELESRLSDLDSKVAPAVVAEPKPQPKRRGRPPGRRRK